MWESDEDHFSRQLLDGERIVWTGAPARGVLLTARDWFLVPFSLFWGGFAIFWESMAAQKGAPLFFMLWGVPFVLVGLFLIVGRFIADAWLRGRTRYALTNQRILIARSGTFPKFTALYLDSLPAIELVEGANSRGTLQFGTPAPMWGRNGFSSWMPSLDPMPQFLAIENAQDVFRRIQRALRPQPS